jgi:hypothetical protein
MKIHICQTKSLDKFLSSLALVAEYHTIWAPGVTDDDACVKARHLKAVARVTKSPRLNARGIGHGEVLLSFRLQAAGDGQDLLDPR